MRDWIWMTLVAAAAIAVNVAASRGGNVAFLVVLWAVVMVALWALGLAGASARKARSQATRAQIQLANVGVRAEQAQADAKEAELALAGRTRPFGVSVDFEGATDPVPCEVIADPEGDVDEAGNPLRWLARPVRIPEGSAGIVSYSVATWPSGHAIALTIEGLEE